MSELKSSAELRSELETIQDRYVEICRNIRELQRQVEILQKEKHDLDGGNLASRPSGDIHQAKARLKDAELREADSVALRIQWIDGKSPYSSKREYVIDKVTAKMIYVRLTGCSSADLFHMNGKPKSRWRHEAIDIRKTFGIDADEVPPNWKPNKESDLHVQSDVERSETLNKERFQ